jgi:branched-chain amino acid transport system ATP-binding protein
MGDLLSLDRVSAGYGLTVVLDDVSLGLARGETVTVLGRNGVGKTTLLVSIMGHTTLHGGAIRFGDARIVVTTGRLAKALHCQPTAWTRSLQRLQRGCHENELEDVQRATGIGPGSR